MAKVKKSPEEFAQELVAKENAKVRKRDDKTVQTEPGENSFYIRHSMRIYSLPGITMSDAEQVQNRIWEYFQICEEDDMKPSVAGIALALGISRQVLYDYRVGNIGKNSEVTDTLKKACQLLDLQMTDYMQNGKINPVSGIFLMKNNFGYADKQEITVKAEQPIGTVADGTELAERYLEDIPTTTEE